MQEAFGGILNLVLIAIFLVIVEGVLALGVSYTKAFKMKNIVISTIEEYETSGCFSSNLSTPCNQRIKERAEAIGYISPNLHCPDEGINGKQWAAYGPEGRQFCAIEIKSNKSAKNFRTYRVLTQVDVDLIIIRDIFSFSFFQIKGDTRIIQLPQVEVDPLS